MSEKEGPEDLDYPDWDRRTNAMPDLNRRVLDDTLKVLKTYFANQPFVYVSGNVPVVFSNDGRRERVIPDVFVVTGLPKRMLRGYWVAQAGKAPDLVIELISRSSLREDSEVKFALYQDVLGVKEYFLFDPLGAYQEPRLKGYRLCSGRYRPILDNQPRLPSDVLGLHMEADGNDLRFFDPTRGHLLRTPQQEADALRRRAEAGRWIRWWRTQNL